MPDASSAPAAGDRLLAAQISASPGHRPALSGPLCSSYSAPGFWRAEGTGWCCSSPCLLQPGRGKATLHLHPRRNFHGNECEEETVSFVVATTFATNLLFQVFQRLILHHLSLTQVSGLIISQHRLQKGYSSTDICSIGNTIREWDL